MSANIGAEKIMSLLNEGTRTGFQSQRQEIPSTTQLEDAVKSSVASMFTPEFINRIDRQIVFNALTDEQYEQVIDVYIKEQNQAALAELGIELMVTEALKTHLVHSCEDRRQMGARSLVRTIKQTVSDELSMYIDAGAIPEDRLVRADIETSDDGRSLVSFLHVPHPIYANTSEQLPAEEGVDGEHVPSASRSLVPIGGVAMKNTLSPDLYSIFANNKRNLIQLLEPVDTGDLYMI